MTTRINELAELAGKHYRAQPGTDMHPSPVVCGAIPQVFLDKFAELLLHEVFASTSAIKAEYQRAQLAACDFGEKNIWAQGQTALTRLEADIQKNLGSDPSTAKPSAGKLGPA